MVENLPSFARTLRFASKGLDLIKAAQHHRQIGSMSCGSSNAGSYAATVKSESLPSLALPKHEFWANEVDPTENRTMVIAVEATNESHSYPAPLTSCASEILAVAR